jgi:hypothetical protein
MNTITDQAIIELAIKYGASIDYDRSLCGDLCGDGMDVVAFAHDIIYMSIKQCNHLCNLKELKDKIK